jgi:ribose transport system substrate-binding protein
MKRDLHMRWHITSILVVLGVFLLGCGKQDETPDSARTTIAVIPKGTTHEFWKSIHAGAAKASRELDVDIIWKGPLKEDDREAQISVMENFISRGVSGIVLAPLDDVALRAPVADAARLGIPVVIIDSGLKSDDYASFVATDNYLGGRIGARKLVELLDGDGRVVMLRCLEGSASTTNREQGFLDEVTEAKGIVVVSSNQYGGPTTETAYRASENMLAPLRGPDGTLTIDGIFCVNESTTFGMLRALQDGGLAGKIRFVGFDSSVKLVEALRRAELDALVLQNPFDMGYRGVRTMVAHLRGEEILKRIDTGVALATPQNMLEPEIAERLTPDLSTWLEE